MTEQSTFAPTVYVTLVGFAASGCSPWSGSVSHGKPAPPMMATTRSLIVIPDAANAGARSAKVASGRILPATAASPSVLPVHENGLLQSTTAATQASGGVSGIEASFEAPIWVAPTGVAPTGVAPTGVAPTGVAPTGAEPSWPATSSCRTVVAGPALTQLPPFVGMRADDVPHQAAKPPGSDDSGVLPASSAAQWTDRRSVVVRSICFSARALR